MRFVVQLDQHTVAGTPDARHGEPVERDLDALCRAAWEEVEPEKFSSFAVRAKRSDKSFPHNVTEIERIVGRLECTADSSGCIQFTQYSSRLAACLRDGRWGNFRAELGLY
ncbi:MAG: hypothetical protein HY012_00425 [Acidobacteria bacterium]|nr:hypothetical protein [Acidobacteriota bacterium]